MEKRRAEVVLLAFLLLLMTMAMLTVTLSYSVEISSEFKDCLKMNVLRSAWWRTPVEAEKISVQSHPGPHSESVSKNEKEMKECLGIIFGNLSLLCFLSSCGSAVHS